MRRHARFLSFTCTSRPLESKISLWSFLLLITYFSAATVSYNDVADINAVSGYVDDPKTVSYRFSPDIMEWKRLIIVYTTEDSGDVLCGMIYQDVTTN